MAALVPIARWLPALSWLGLDWGSGMHSPYQQLKNHVLALVGISKDAVHLYIGIGCLLVSILVLRLPPTSYKALILTLLVSLGMEAMDLHDNVRYRDTTRAMASAHDIWNTNLMPLLVVTALRLRLGPPTGGKRGKRGG
jgi:hypothetical protein